MIRSNWTRCCAAVISVFLGLLLVMGCGSSVEKNAMSDFLKKYSETVNEYSAADASQKAALKGKLDEFESKWSDMKMEMGGHVTPQALDELDHEYMKIKKRYSSATG